MDVGIKKLTVAVKQYNEDRLFQVWSRSMSDKPFEEWKKSLEKRAENEQKKQTGEGAITGKDLAHI